MSTRYSLAIDPRTAKWCLMLHHAARHSRFSYSTHMRRLRVFVVGVLLEEDEVTLRWHTNTMLGCQKPGHLAVRLGCAKAKVATWDDLAFKLIILRWNMKHSILQNVDPWLKFKIAHSPKI
ncbi:hypothetical protein Tco_0068132 [Tanacetum coccineum]